MFFHSAVELKTVFDKIGRNHDFVADDFIQQNPINGLSVIHESLNKILLLQKENILLCFSLQEFLLYKALSVNTFRHWKLRRQVSSNFSLRSFDFRDVLRSCNGDAIAHYSFENNGIDEQFGKVMG